MADFRQCILTAKNAGEISDQEAADIMRMFDDYERQAKLDSGDATASVAAARKVSERLDAEVKQRKREALITVAVTRRLKRDLAGFRDWKNRPNIVDAALTLLEHFGRAGFSSIEGRRKAILARAHARIDQMFLAFKPDALGRQDEVLADDVGRALKGEAVKDPRAKAMADSFAAANEELRIRYNRAGGAIAKLDDWGLPQTHDGRAVYKAGRDTWKREIAPLLDVARMRHPLTDEPLSDGELDGVLDHVWESITTEGWNNRVPSRVPFGVGSLARRRMESRFLVYKDFDSWKAYQERFGGSGGNVIHSLTHHLEIMARDIAAMEILGPNPQATMAWLEQLIQSEVAQRKIGKPSLIPDVKDPDSYARRRLGRLGEMWTYMRGGANVPAHEGIATAVDTARNITYAAKLGSAAVSAITDIGFQTVSRAYLGMPIGRVVIDVARQIPKGSHGEAAAAALIVDHTLGGLHREARYSYDMMGTGWSRWLAERTMQWSGLSAMTRAGRESFGLGVQHEVGKLASARTAWENVPAPLREAFQGYGVTEADWRLFKLAGLYRPRGVPFLRPQEITDLAEGNLDQLDGIFPLSAGGDEAVRRQRARELTRGAAERYLEMILSETEYAVPSSSVRAKTALVSVDAKPGTFKGTLSRSWGMLKSFSATVITLHGQRLLWDLGRGRIGRGAAYATGLLMTTGALAAVALQAKLFIAGKDPRDMSKPEFWGAALLQGGGLGLYGDFLFSDLNRFGGGIGSTIAGPLAEEAGDLINLTIGNAAQLVTGQETNFGKELVDFAAWNVPGANLWYTRLGYERWIVDNLRRLVNPAAEEAFRSKVRAAERAGSGFWWAPGTPAPQRVPGAH